MNSEVDKTPLAQKVAHKVKENKDQIVRVLSALGLIVTGCAPKVIAVEPTFQPASNQKTEIQLPTTTPASVETLATTKTPEPSSTSTPTAEPTITPPTHETIKEVQCGILPAEYCSQAEVIERTPSSGQGYKMIGFRLPPGVPIFLPADGQIPKTKLNEDVAFYKGYQAIVFDPNNPNGLRYKFPKGVYFYV